MKWNSTDEIRKILSGKNPQIPDFSGNTSQESIGAPSDNPFSSLIESILGGKKDESTSGTGNIIGDALGGIKDTVTDKIPDAVTGNIQKPSYGNYVESDTVKEAKAALEQQMAQKPGPYQSAWQNSLDEAMNKILNREEFSYDLNGDALYQQYKDQYINQGRQAMMNAIGKASALTGGYANSWAQSAGQQTFQNYLQQLNDKIPELYKLAMDKYNMTGEQLMDQLAILLEREGIDYNRYRDAMSDFLAERGYLTDRYDTERNYDYNKFTDNRDFNYQTDRDKISDEQWEKEFDEAVRQYLASADPEVRAAYNALGGSLGGLGGGTMGNMGDINSILGMLGGSYGSGSGIKINGSGKTPSVKTKSDSDIVNEIIRGDWGNGQARKDALKKAGYTDAEIKKLQEQVNKKMDGIVVDDDLDYDDDYSDNSKSMFEQATGSSRYDNVGTKFTTEEYKAFEKDVGMNRTTGGKATTIVDALIEGKITETQADKLQKKYNLTDEEIEKALGMTPSTTPKTKANTNSSTPGKFY